MKLGTELSAHAEAMIAEGDETLKDIKAHYLMKGLADWYAAWSEDLAAGCEMVARNIHKLFEDPIFTRR